VAGAVNFLFTMTQNMTCWSSEEDELLIDFVKSHEMLYNVKSKDYGQAQLKQNLWCEISGTHKYILFLC
jgi:hypothetical protein